MSSKNHVAFVGLSLPFPNFNSSRENKPHLFSVLYIGFLFLSISTVIELSFAMCKLSAIILHLMVSVN